AAAIPGPSGRGCKTDKAAVSGEAGEKLVTQVITECETAIWAARRIAGERGEVELVSGKRRRVVRNLIFARAINLDAAGEIPGLADRKDSLRNSSADDEIAHGVVTRVVIEADIGEQSPSGAQPGLKVERRHIALEAIERESRQGIECEKLIALA